MKKLIILKSLLDFIWIFTCIPLMALLLFFSVYMFINPESIDLIFNESLQGPPVLVQIFALLLIVICSVGVYCLYLFRKTVRYFQRAKPFHVDVIDNFHKIGYLLSTIGLGGTVLFFIARLVIKNELRFNLSISPYLMLACLGLFFMVLSEVFKIAKHAKEENNLTI